MSKILVIADLHLPWVHPQYKRFCLDTKRRFKTTQTVFAGDVVDLCGLGFWEQDPDGMSPGSEMGLAQSGVTSWYKAFPKAKVCIGNHDARTIRLARKSGVPMKCLKDFHEIWGTPGWDWGWEHEIDNILFLHGTGSGRNAVFNLMIKRRKSVCMGHTHSGAGTVYHSNKEGDLIFGLNVGTGLDAQGYAFHYAKDHPDRPILGCGVILDGEPHFIPMPCDKGEKYAR